MSGHFIQALQAIATILAVFAMIWKFRKDILTEVDKKFDTFKSDVDKRFDTIDKRFDTIDKRFDAIDKRFEKIEATLETMQQNHLDHIIQLHVNPHVAPPTPSKEQSS